MLAGLPHARDIFNVAFCVVLVSLALQGWSLPAVARWLGVEREPRAQPALSMERRK
jgi:cell volume regulation protein A